MTTHSSSLNIHNWDVDVGVGKYEDIVSTSSYDTPSASSLPIKIGRFGIVDCGGNDDNRLFSEQQCNEGWYIDLV